MSKSWDILGSKVNTQLLKLMCRKKRNVSDFESDFGKGQIEIARWRGQNISKTVSLVGSAVVNTYLKGQRKDKRWSNKKVIDSHASVVHVESEG